MSIGTDRVRVDFNPASWVADPVGLDGLTDRQRNARDAGLSTMAELATDVDKLKRLTADLIDACEVLKKKDPRLAALAQTAYEEAAMWAVKAATAP